MDTLLQGPFYYVIWFAVFLVLFWLCTRYGNTVRKVTVLVAALTILGLLAYTAVALLNLLIHQP